MSAPQTTGCNHTCNQGRTCGCQGTPPNDWLLSDYFYALLSLGMVLGWIWLLFFLAGFISEYLAS